MKFYVSTYTEGFFGEGPNGSKGIYLCEYDEIKNDFTILNSFDNSANPSFIKLSKDKKNLFVACEKLPPSRIDNYLVDEKGNLYFNDSVQLGYRSPCYISCDKENKFVAVANYGSGSIFTYMFDEKVKFFKQMSNYKNYDIGPNKDRQEMAHAHSIRLIEALNTYVACDLGCDKIDFYDYEAGGYLTRSNIKSLKTPAGYGPRHTTNSKDGKYLYVTCELMNRILFYELINGQYLLKQDISSVPDIFDKGNAIADIHESNDFRYIFVSNRGKDDIVQYLVNNDGTLTQVASADCKGKGPRNFAVTDDYVICANQDSNNCTILEIKDGLLTGKVLCSKEFISPVCIEKI